MINSGSTGNVHPEGEDVLVTEDLTECLFLELIVDKVIGHISQVIHLIFFVILYQRHIQFNLNQDLNTFTSLLNGVLDLSREKFMCACLLLLD